jgi:N-acetylglucosaminyl-diphospho-decaprenol L-rhamnosyltransferase
MSRLSVVFVNYRSGRFLKTALHAVLQSLTSNDFEILIVNNDSAADLLPLQGRNWPSTRIIQNASNLGFGTAANLGYRQSSGKHVLLLNPDVLVQPGSVEALIRTSESRLDAGIVIPQLRHPDGTLQYSCRRFYSYSTLLMRRGPWRALFENHSGVRAHLMQDWEHDSLAEVDWGIGAAMLIRRDAITDSSLFDEQFFLYFEDVDLCLRMRRAGWKVLYQPAAVMIHRHQRDSARLGSWGAKRHHFLSLMKFLRKHRFQPGG